MADENLKPPLLESGHSSDLHKQYGFSLANAMSPANNGFAVYVTGNPGKRKADVLDTENVYLASLDEIPQEERRLFISDTSVIFSAFRSFMKAAETKGHAWLESEQSLAVIRKLATDYANFTKECWVHASTSEASGESLQFNAAHYKSLHTCLSLFIVLYLPEKSYANLPVGDDLLEWLNTYFIEPSSEDGLTLSKLEAPWEDEEFWPFLITATLRGLTKSAVFFLNSLSKHPSADLQDLAQEIAPLVENRPQSHSFKTDKEYHRAYKRWLEQVKILRVEMVRVPEDKRWDDYENWWIRLSTILGILEGSSQHIADASQELDSSWREKIIADTVYVHTNSRRQDLSVIAERSLLESPPDPTELEDSIHASLLSGNCLEALEWASQLDPWLSAHLADIMDALGLIEESPSFPRDQYTLAYADYLRTDPAVWRLTVEYYCSCGPQGELRADEVITRVPLRLTDVEAAETTMTQILQEVSETCRDYKREEARRTVCRIASQKFARKREYGLAVSYSMTAEDWTGLGRIVDTVLDEYLSTGPSEFIAHATNIAPLIQKIRSNTDVPMIFMHRLMFVVRLAEMEQRRQDEDWRDCALYLTSMFSDRVAPKSWWAVLLSDALHLLQNSQLLFTYSGACELLKALEEVFTQTAHGSSGEFLTTVKRKLGAKEDAAALQNLNAVRLALARYLARCTYTAKAIS